MSHSRAYDAGNRVLCSKARFKLNVEVQDVSIKLTVDGRLKSSSTRQALRCMSVIVSPRGLPVGDVQLHCIFRVLP